MLRWKQSRTFLRMNSTSETKLVRYEKIKQEYTDIYQDYAFLKMESGGNVFQLLLIRKKERLIPKVSNRGTGGKLKHGSCSGSEWKSSYGKTAF